MFVVLNIKVTDCFHVHTRRCGHAENIPDEEYIKKALDIGATGIWFTDHAPFPGDYFRNRMRYAELPEYIGSLSLLKEQYRGLIDIHIGLEIEYFPSYDMAGYYKELRSNMDIECLLLGQHMAETDDGYTFTWKKERLIREEYIVLANAELQGIESGYFDAVAHPDRIFRRLNEWSLPAQMLSNKIIEAANKMNIPLEQNESSKRRERNYWPEFWEFTEGAEVIHGLDAHSMKELIFDVFS